LFSFTCTCEALYRNASANNKLQFIMYYFWPRQSCKVADKTRITQCTIAVNKLYKMGITDQPKKTWWLLPLLIFIPGLYCFYSPLMLSVDSLYGFLAYKGSVITGSFNVIADVSQPDISLLNKEFVSWWSPGQWLVPGLLVFLTGMPPGIASIIVTIVFGLLGLAGFYKLYRYYQFPSHIIFLALLCMSLGDTVTQNFTIYQGGEVLSFGIFPWFFLYVMQTRKPSLTRLCIIALFFLACFLAKITLVVYCSLVLLYKLIEPGLFKPGWRKRFNALRSLNILFAIPLLIVLWAIYSFFISRGVTPTVGKPDLVPVHLLGPLSSPITSILSIRKLILSVQRLFPGNTVNGQLIIAGSYLLLIAMIFWIGRYMWKNKMIVTEYKYVGLLLYIGVGAFFAFAYIMHTNIDHGARHFKYLGFLFLPVLLLFITERLPVKVYMGLFSLIFLLNVLSFVRLKGKLTAGKYISASYFVRSNTDLHGHDRLDEGSYNKLMVIEKRFTRPDTTAKLVIFAVEATPDVALDIRALCITGKQGEDFWVKKYQGRGPMIIAAVINRDTGLNAQLLKLKFPDYPVFSLFDQTDGYQYFIAK
jgi:hypothetical protein